jgi:uncharacterized protein
MFKRLSFVLICLMTISVADAADIRFPELTGRIVDNAHLLDAATANQINQQLASYEQQTTNQIVVVTVPDLNNIAIEDYGYRLGRAWQIGQKGKNNGALLIVAPKEHKVRIEVGYGLEGDLTDAASAMIINRLITPAFKKGDYNGGIQQGVTAMITALGGMGEDAKTAQAKENHGSNNTIHFWLLALIFILFLRWLRSGKGGIAMPFILGSMLGGSGGDDEDEGGGFSGGGGSFGGGGSSGSW